MDTKNLFRVAASYYRGRKISSVTKYDVDGILSTIKKPTDMEKQFVNFIVLNLIARVSVLKTFNKFEDHNIDFYVMEHSVFDIGAPKVYEDMHELIDLTSVFMLKNDFTEKEMDEIESLCLENFPPELAKELIGTMRPKN